MTVDLPQDAVDISGRFEPGPDFESYRLAFNSILDAAMRVDVAPDSEYLQAWFEWETACQAVVALGISYGEHRLPVESFEIDSDSCVHFSLPLFWLVSDCRSADAEPGVAADHEEV